jgi:DNA repair protein RecN (Recombination protein N)
MLKELRIKNLAIIDDLTVSFGEGLNVLTGETGAGKSIIVDSLDLALGSRAQSDLVRSGEKEAVVQAWFDIQGGTGISDMGIDPSDGLIIRRAVSSSGKSRAYINDTMISLQKLAEIGRSLVDIHGQHEHQSLFSVDKHRDFIDAFGKLQDDGEKLGRLYHEVSDLKQAVADLKQRTRERQQRLDLLKFQIQEIDSASLRTGEKEDLARQKTILSNRGRLNELAETAYSALYSSDRSCMEQLSSIRGKVKEMSSIDQGISDILSMLDSAYPALEEAAIALRTYRDKYDFEPERLSEIEERTELIRKLERKYGEGIEDIIRYRSEAEAELRGLEHMDEKRDALEAELQVKEKMLMDMAHSLSGKRRKAAGQMEGLVRNELKELALSSAVFLIQFREEEVSPSGIDRVEFLFSANPGEPAKPLVKIASGGELSRVMLALKGILADCDSIPVLIFDEVDAGIGGKTAESVGRKLKALSKRHQVLCTTHLPQIASRGDCHFKTEKAEKDKRVSVAVTELSGKERLREIARMLSGNVTEVSLKHAKELIEGTL